MESSSINGNLRVWPMLLQASARIREEQEIAVTNETAPSNDEFRKLERIMEEMLNNSTTNMCWKVRLENKTNLNEQMLEPFSEESMPTDKELAEIALLTVTAGEKFNPLSKETESIKEFVAPSPSLSIIKHEKPIEALTKILTTPNYDPYIPQLYVLLTLKKAISLAEHSLREHNLIYVDLDNDYFLEQEDDKWNLLNLIGSNIIVIHQTDEFLTFCTCNKCIVYREAVFHILLEQFQVTHMAVLLLDVLVKTYGPILK